MSEWRQRSELEELQKRLQQLRDELEQQEKQLEKQRPEQHFIFFSLLEGFSLPKSPEVAACPSLVLTSEPCDRRVLDCVSHARRRGRARVLHYTLTYYDYDYSILYYTILYYTIL